MPPPDRVSGDNAIHHINPESPQDHGGSGFGGLGAGEGSRTCAAVHKKWSHPGQGSSYRGEPRGGIKPTQVRVRPPGDVQIRQNLDAA